MSAKCSYLRSGLYIFRKTATGCGFVWHLLGLYLVIFWLSSSLSAQTPMLNVAERSPAIQLADTLKTPTRLHLPGRAAMLSATLPGLGQAYNGAYWKIPVIYAGFGAVAYAVNFNNKEYLKMRKAYLAKVDGNPNTPDNYPQYTDTSLKRAMEYYRRNLELSYILAAALYLINILDANVQAHLMDFDVSEDLSLKIEPNINLNSAHTGSLGYLPALKFTLRF